LSIVYYILMSNLKLNFSINLWVKFSSYMFAGRSEPLTLLINGRDLDALIPLDRRKGKGDQEELKRISLFVFS